MGISQSSPVNISQWLLAGWLALRRGGSALEFINKSLFWEDYVSTVPVLPAASPKNKQGQAEIAEFKHHYRKLSRLVAIIWGHYFHSICILVRPELFQDRVTQSRPLPSPVCDWTFLLTWAETNTRHQSRRKDPLLHFDDLWFDKMHAPFLHFSLK